MSLTIVIAAPDKSTNHPIFVRTEVSRADPIPIKVSPNYPQDDFNPNIRPKNWGIKNCRLIIGCGPYKAYRRLMGTQHGLVFRADHGPVIIAIANSLHGAMILRDQVSRKIHSDDRARLGITKHESTITMPSPHIAKRHHHKAKRRKSLANRHLTWWVKTPGFPKNLEPPEVTDIDRVIEETRRICNGVPKREIPLHSR